MARECYSRKWVIKILLLCVLAAGANYVVSTLFLKVPLFLDTLFSAAICFTVGLWPALLTALLTQVATCIRLSSIPPFLFVLCSIAEMLLIYWLNPARSKTSTSLAGTFAGLLLLYIAACIVISVLGGVIDFTYHGILAHSKLYYSPEDTFKISLSLSETPILAMDIFSRIPVNIVDRFIVIFGGFFISLGLKRLKV